MSVYLLVVVDKIEQRNADRELHIERTRRFMALFANANRSKHSREYTPQDFWVLSYDNKEEEPDNVKYTSKTIKQQLGTIFKRNV